MNHLLLFLACLISVEIFIKLKFLDALNLLVLQSRKAARLIQNDRISDHWKEVTIPAYALSMMRSCLKIIIIIILIASIFYLVDLFLMDFLMFTLSLAGVAESIIFAIIYLRLRSIILE